MKEERRRRRVRIGLFNNVYEERSGATLFWDTEQRRQPNRFARDNHVCTNCTLVAPFYFPTK